MKKLSKEQRKRLKNFQLIQQDRLARRNQRDALELLRRKKKQFIVRHFSSRRVYAPPILCLARPKDHAMLTERISQLKNVVSLEHVSTVYVDLSKIEKLYPDGTLLFVSEIESILESRFGQKLVGVYPTDDTVEQLFQHIGLIEKLGLPNRIEKIDAESVVHWLYVSSDKADLNSIVADLPEVLTTSNNTSLRLAVTTGMSEAVANSSEHAYKLPRGDKANFPASQKWWMFAKREEDDIYVLVCDLGAGIPRTLGSTWPEELERFLKTMIRRRREDHELIKWALKLGRTSTQQKHRGRGLKDIHKMVKEEKVGRLVIISNKGIYKFEGTSQQVSAKSRESSIHGTIVQWTVPISAFEKQALINYE